jgi:aldehyde:ferredoxin oxidoreductase
MGKYLFVDLDKELIEERDSSRYIPFLLGGYGMALGLIWDLTKGTTGEFDPDNLLVFATGPFTGTPAPSSGRIEIAALAPQSYPVPWVSDSGMGGELGPKMKFAGYDAIAIKGKLQDKKYLFIEDEKAELLSADWLWGKDTYETQILLKKRHGSKSTCACIGPAGENLVRWSIIDSGFENASGQGGFGAVMGSKKLKALVCTGGRKRIAVSDPERLIEASIEITKAYRQGQKPEKVRGNTFGHEFRLKAGCVSCQFCKLNFERCYRTIPRRLGEGEVKGNIFGTETCVADAIKCKFDSLSMSEKERWETQFELAQLITRLGLNLWETNIGIPAWLARCVENHTLSEFMGEEIKVTQWGDHWLGSHLGQTPGFWKKMFTLVAKREGIGDLLAEGIPRAVKKLGYGEQEAKLVYKHGYAPHWDGRELHFIPFPIWIVSALTWAMRGRDPMSSTHGFSQNLSMPVKEWFNGPMPYTELKRVAKELYGTELAVAGFDKPELGYISKEIPAIWHDHASMLKNSMIACDQAYFDGPLLWIERNHKFHAGDYKAIARIFRCITGMKQTFEELMVSAERIFNLMRAIHVRQGRTRVDDESVIAYFEQPDHRPEFNTPHTIDRLKFRKLLDRYYEKRDWDKKTGWPTEEKLEELGLGKVSRELEKLGKLPS